MMNELPSYVFDTNTLLSSLLSPNQSSTTALAYKKAVNSGVFFCSDETYAELADVIFRKNSINIYQTVLVFHSLKTSVK